MLLYKFCMLLFSFLSRRHSPSSSVGGLPYCPLLSPPALEGRFSTILHVSSSEAPFRCALSTSGLWSRTLFFSIHISGAFPSTTSSLHPVAYSLSKGVDDHFRDWAEVFCVGPKYFPVGLERFPLMMWSALLTATCKAEKSRRAGEAGTSKGSSKLSPKTRSCDVGARTFPMLQGQSRVPISQWFWNIPS